MGEIPILRYEVPLKSFRLLQEKGKTIGNGGFGVIRQVASPATTDACCSDNDSLTALYVWIEEAIFLHERGLAEVQNESSESMTSYQLYSKLDECGLSLLSYRSYAHLRSQDYRVVRHAPNRIAILKSLMGSSSSKSRALLMKYREEMQQRASPPKCNNLAWHCYQPNSCFRRSNPGLPDFMVFICSFTMPSPTYKELQDVLGVADGITIKIAAVSDGGTVCMFGLTDFGVPSIVDRKMKTAEKKDKQEE